MSCFGLGNRHETRRYFAAVKRNGRKKLAGYIRNRHVLRRGVYCGWIDGCRKSSISRIEKISIYKNLKIGNKKLRKDIVLYGLKNCRINLIRSFFYAKIMGFLVSNCVYNIRLRGDSRCFFYIVVIC